MRRCDARAVLAVWASVLCWLLAAVCACVLQGARGACMHASRCLQQRAAPSPSAHAVVPARLPPACSPSRLPPACRQVNKEDLLSMVRYGAELVFSSEASNITGAAACRECLLRAHCGPAPQRRAHCVAAASCAACCAWLHLYCMRAAALSSFWGAAARDAPPAHARAAAHCAAWWGLQPPPFAPACVPALLPPPSSHAARAWPQPAGDAVAWRWRPRWHAGWGAHGVRVPARRAARLAVLLSRTGASTPMLLCMTAAATAAREASTLAAPAQQRGALSQHAVTAMDSARTLLKRAFV